jgi:hypothetical protein
MESTLMNTHEKSFERGRNGFEKGEIPVALLW